MYHIYRPCASPGVTGRSVLNLRTTGLDEQTCALLGKLLSIDRLFEQIDLGDCALSDNGEPTLLFCGTGAVLVPLSETGFT